jgi:hypothetical protein
VSRPAAVRPLIIVAAVFGYLYFLTESPVLHGDAVTDLLRARRCVLSGDTCWMSGGPTANVFQGAAWVQFLSACRIVGLDVMQIKQVTVWSFVVSALLVDAIYRRHLRGDAACALVLALWVAAAPMTIGFPATLWNWTFIPLASALFFHFFFTFLEETSWRALLCCAVALAILCDLHILGAALVAPLALAIGLRAETPVAMAAAAFGTIAIVAFADSPGTWLANGRTAIHHPSALLTLLIPMATTYLGMRLRPHVRRPITARAWAAGTLAAFGIAAVAASMLADRAIAKEGPHYLGIVLPLGVIAAAQGMTALSRRAGRFSSVVVPGVPVAVLVLVSVVPLAYDRLNLRPDLAEIEALSRWLHAQSSSYRGDAILRGLHGEAGFTVLRTLLAFEDAVATSQPDTRQAVNLLVLPGYRRSALPLGWAPLTVGYLPGRFIAVSSIPSFIDGGAAQVCVEPPVSACRAWVPSYADDAAYESYRMDAPPSDATPGSAVRYTFHVDVPTGSEPHIIRTQAGWSVTAASGLRVRGDLPAARCVIEGGSEQHGTLSFTRAGGYDARVAPVWTEVTSDAETLLDTPGWPYFRDDPDLVPF